MVKKEKLNSVEHDLVEGMENFLADLKNDVEIGTKYTCRRIVLDLQSKSYTADDVKATRGLLMASQAVFAQFLGVSTKTICGWEAGKAPSGMACRFMDEIRTNPDYWRNRLRAMIQTTTA